MSSHGKYGDPKPVRQASQIYILTIRDRVTRKVIDKRKYALKSIEESQKLREDIVAEMEKKKVDTSGLVVSVRFSRLA